jgi:hypothetical protein
MGQFPYYKKRPGGVRKRRGDLEKRATFRLDAKHMEELQDYSEKEGMTVSAMVRHLVIRFLENKRKAVETVIPRVQF